MDALGNLVRVIEPDPAGGTWITNYTYTALESVGREHAAEQWDAEPDVRLHRGGSDERDESGERDGEVQYDNRTGWDQDGRAGAGDAVHVRRLRRLTEVRYYDPAI